MNIFINISIIFMYLSLGVFTFFKTRKLNKTLILLEESKLQNKALQNLNDNLRTFKHDFFNIIQSIDGCVKTKNFSALGKYYKDIKKDCDETNNLCILTSEIIDEPVVYNLITSKYFKAEQNGVSFDINIMTKFSSLNISSYVLSRVLGILLDNAIENASVSAEKKLVLEVFPNFSDDNINIIIQNSYSNKDVNLDKISEKGFTSKKSESRFSWVRFMGS